jgi:hypothetical protein
MTAPTQRDMSWAVGIGEGKIGTGNWRAFPKERLPELFEIAAGWKRQFIGIDKPWLCWCLDDEWSVLQQRLVKAVGWTPVVGTDGRVPHPTVIPGAVFVDFNREFQFATIWMHFPLEFQFRFCRRLAFWHSDVLPPVSVMREIACWFDRIEDGQYIGVMNAPGLRQYFTRPLRGKPFNYKRWFEVLGCTTEGASRSQYEHGCGWWRNIQLHPNAQQEIVRRKPFHEHGVGVWFWQRYCGGTAIQLPIKIESYHYSTHKAGYRRYRTVTRELLGGKQEELRRSFNLKEITTELGFEDTQSR